MDVLNYGGERDVSPKQQISSPSLLDNLKRRQMDAKSRLSDLDAAIEAIEKNPDIAKVLDLVARAR